MRNDICHLSTFCGCQVRSDVFIFKSFKKTIFLCCVKYLCIFFTMNIICSICTELFTIEADAHFTQCGHVFHHHCLISWLERSKSCPDCRNGVTKKTIQKAYFNISNDDQAQIDYFKLKAKEADRLSDEIIELKSSIRNMKKALLDSEKEVRDRDSNLKNYKNEYSKLKKYLELLNARNAVTRRELQQLKIKNKKEANILKQRLKEANINNIVVANPNLTSISNTDSILEEFKNKYSMLKIEHERLQARNTVTRSQLHQLLKIKNLKEGNILNQSLKCANINNNIVANPEAGSPKLTSTSESNQSNLEASTDVSVKLEQHSNGHKLPGVKTGTENDRICVDGLGDSQKADVYPVPKGLKRNKSSSSISSRKFKKLAPNTSFNTTITDFANLCE